MNSTNKSTIRKKISPRLHPAWYPDFLDRFCWEGLFPTLSTHRESGSTTMTKNEKYLAQALELIPWGTQTGAKRHSAEMGEAMPAFIDRAKGCRMWDLDGREYIDYRCSLGPIILGYCYQEVDDAVRAQMEKGSIFSMASPIELEVARLVHDMVPCAEMVRFMKTGADANMCSVRIARAVTGRERIVIRGYHGYHDYFLPAQQGVPQAVRDLVHAVPDNDVEKLREVFRTNGERIAAMLMEPYGWGDDTSGAFAREARRLTTQYGALLIFDEVLTGFRLAKGGAQEYFGVVPDLASFAKAVANGYPVSVYCGKRQYMSKLNEITLTTTYAGDAISLAAAKATLTIMKREPVHKHIWAMGERLMEGMREIGRRAGVNLRASGVGVSPRFAILDEKKDRETALNTAWRRQLFAHGVFPHWFVGYSHRPEDIDETIERADSALKAALRATA